MDLIAVIQRRVFAWCCARKRPAGGAGGATATSSLVGAWRTQPDNAAAVGRACTGLQNLTTNRGNQVIAVRDGLLSLIAAALRNPLLERQTPPLAPRLCSLLSCLVEENPDHQAVAAQAGIIPVLLSVAATASELHRGPTGAAEGVAAAACRALWATIFDCPPNQALAVREGALPVLVALLSPPPAASSALLIEASSKAIRTLTVFSADHAAAARSAGAVSALQAVLESLATAKAREHSQSEAAAAAATAVERALGVLVL